MCDDSREVNLYKVFFEEEGDIYCKTINGYNITEFFSNNYNMPNVKATLFEIIDLLPSSTKKYLKTKLKEKKDKDSIGVSEMTNDFQYVIFENSLPDQITQTKLKSLVKGFRGSKYFITNMIYLIKAVMTKYSEQTNYNVIMEELKTNITQPIYERFYFYDTSFYNKLRVEEKLNISAFLKVIREDEKICDFLLDIMKEKVLEIQTENLVYLIEDSIKEESQKTKIKNILITNYNSKLTDKYISYRLMTQEERAFIKKIHKRQFVEQNRELF